MILNGLKNVRFRAFFVTSPWGVYWESVILQQSKCLKIKEKSPKRKSKSGALPMKNVRVQ